MTGSFLLAAAATIEPDGLLWSSREVRDYLELLADQLEPGEIIDQQMEKVSERTPLTGPHLAEALGRLLFRAEAPTSNYSRCVQVSQLLGDAANRLAVKGDHTRADLLREYAHAVSIAGNAVAERPL